MVAEEPLVVLDRRTNDNVSTELGDFISCCNCGKTMLVNIGTKKCPECDEKTLAWVDEDEQEVASNFFDNNTDYVLVDVE